ncbi:aspartyl/asparaginyl beta-hydroxylase domain-containing protein, partial [bacterium]|nr:aspartyl/asparaginyl beta-hydroxylase domain-containing protein [bacterium]
MSDTKLNLKHLFDGRNIISLDSRYETMVNWDELKREAENLENLYVDHSSGDLKKWQALCLHGLGTEKTSDAKSYGYMGGDVSTAAQEHMGWTEAALLSPQMTQFLKSLPFVEFFRVRLFKMNPGGYVGWHGDEGWNGIEDEIDHYTLMVAIYAPKDSAVIFDNGETFSYHKNRSALINFNRWHCATNPSDENRYMLKIHGRISKNFMDWVRGSIEAMSEKKESIVWGVWSVDLKDPWINKKCQQMTVISIPSDRSVLGKNPDALLSKLQDKADYVVLVKAGTFIDSPLEIEKEILARKPDFFAHILNYQNEYPFLHDQFVVVSTKKWRELGRPSFTENLGTENRFADYEASVENFHDDYTPHFLKPTGKVIKGISRFGSRLISDVLASGDNFLNVPQEIRVQKLYMYPHHGSIKSLRKRWQDLDESVHLHENHLRFF